MGNKTKPSVRTSLDKEVRRTIVKAIHNYAVEMVNILGYSNFNEIMIYIDPVLTLLKRRWETSDQYIIAAAMYNYGYIEGKSDERKRRAVK